MGYFSFFFYTWYFETIQSLLDLALRTTAAAADPCHEELTCCVVSNFLYHLTLHLYWVADQNWYSFSFPHFFLSPSLTQERSSLLHRLGTLKDLEYGMKNLVTLSSEIDKPYSDSNDQAESVSITGLETFSLCYKVCCVLCFLVIFFPFSLRELYDPALHHRYCLLLYPVSLHVGFMVQDSGV